MISTTLFNFSEIVQELFSSIIFLAQTKSVEPGTCVHRAGDIANTISVLEEGEIKTVPLSGQHTHQPKYLFAGSFLGMCDKGVCF